MADLNQDVLEEIAEERAAASTPELDSTTLFTARLPGIRATAAATNLQDTNQALDAVLPD